LFDSTATFGPLALTVDNADQDGQAVYSFGPEDALLRTGLTVVVRPDDPGGVLVDPESEQARVLGDEA
jgi:hypothetical protein